MNTLQGCNETQRRALLLLTLHLRLPPPASPLPQCIAINKFGCQATVDCCDSKKCEFQTESSQTGQCKEVRFDLTGTSNQRHSAASGAAVRCVHCHGADCSIGP